LVVDRSRKQIRITRERSRPSILVLGIIATLAYAGFNWVHSAEVVTLEARGAGAERHVANVYFVDDSPFVWVLAGSEDDPWLRAVRQGARVEMHRGVGEPVPYLGRASRDPEALARAGQLFDAKYGLLGRVGSLLGDPVIVRLEPVY
jgi:hypothetical protein